MYEKRLLFTLAVTILVFGAFIYTGIAAKNAETQIQIRKNATNFAKEDIKFIHAQIAPTIEWFYWLSPTNTIQIYSEITFIRLAVKLNISLFYFESGTNWDNKFGFTLKGNNAYGFDDVNFIYKVDGTAWTWGEN